MKKLIHILLSFIFPITGINGQFAPAAGVSGSTAIYKDDISILGWAKSCSVNRGFINKSDTTVKFSQDGVTSNHAFFGTEQFAVGAPGGALDCISLGDRGTATLAFDFPIRNGLGADFAIFENGIKMQEAPYHYFLELAFVEVSTNGKRFVRFPAVSNTPVATQIASFGQIDPVQIHNFAGKYVANYGTPFDLEDIKDSLGINIDSINYIRLIDVVGSIDPKFASVDSKGQIVNDPFPTEFWSGGFDLDAIGVMHFNGITGFKEDKMLTGLRVYPNPAISGSELTIQYPDWGDTQLVTIGLWSVMGIKTYEWHLNYAETSKLILPELERGLYFLKIQTSEGQEIVKLKVE